MALWQLPTAASLVAAVPRLLAWRPFRWEYPAPCTYCGAPTHTERGGNFQCPKCIGRIKAAAYGLTSTSTASTKAR
jgi:hypothetical protein